MQTNLVEGFAVVDTDNRADHFRDNDHVAKVSLDDLWLLIWRGLLLRAAQLLHERHRLTLQASGEPPAGTGVHQLHELLTEILLIHVKNYVKSKRDLL